MVIHTPGPEIESMTPRTASEVLYNDIIPISVVSDEHRLLKRVLSSVARVHETTDLLAAALADEGVKRRLVDAVCTRGPAAARREELLSLDREALVDTLVAGLRARRDTLTEVLVGREYDLPPLPNLYFMRDSSVVVRDQVVVGAMAHAVRSNEAAIMRAIFTAPDAPANGGLLYDGGEEQANARAAAVEPDPATPTGTGVPPRLAGGAPDPRLEGGDVLVVRSDLLVVGVSQRSSSESLDALAARLLDSSRVPLTVLAVVLPNERSTIHLDMIFTLVDRDAALVYEPYVTGPRSVDVYSLHLEPGRPTKVAKCDGLLPALAAEGVELESIPCGGRDPVVREREQWLSA
ncbi:MAG: arginine deiminase family protein, partial [Spirochaetota bacterium]